MPAGRPPKYETPKDIQGVIDLYFLACKINRTDAEGGEALLETLSDDELMAVKDIEDVVPTVSGLAYALGMSRQALTDYEGKDEFLVTIKRAKQRVEMSLEQRLAGNAVAGSIFNLKNNFGWKDKTEQEIKATVGLTDLSEAELNRKLKQLESQREQSGKD